MRVLFDVLCLIINRLIGTRPLHKIHTFPETIVNTVTPLAFANWIAKWPTPPPPPRINMP